MEIADRLVWEFPKGLLNWYHFDPHGQTLYIGDSESAVSEFLQEHCAKVFTQTVKTSLEETFLAEHVGAFDYIVVIGEVEYLEHPIPALFAWKTLLNAHGRVLLGMENRLGLRYFCGDRDPFTHRVFDGVDHYRSILAVDRSDIPGRNYSRDEICEMLDAAGWRQRKFYSVLPDLRSPQLIYAENYLPKEELGTRYFPRYDHPDSVFLEEEYLYTDLIKNGLFHAMANAYLIEYSSDEVFEDVLHVTLSMDRGKENAVATIIRSNQTVEKRILYPEGNWKLKALEDNAEDLAAHGLHVLRGTVQDHAYIMPYVNKEIATDYLRRLAKQDVEEFIKEVDRFCHLILQSSEHVDGERETSLGVILKRGYWDLVPLNCFWDEGRYLFYDQEFYEENYPANAMIYKMLEVLYVGDTELEAIVSIRYFWKRYHLEEQREIWQNDMCRSIAEVRHQSDLRIFYEKVRRNPEVTNTNRQRMNYSGDEYRRIFVDIFFNAENKKIILFGSGNFTNRFLVQFRKDYQIDAIVDNDSSKWGSELEGIPIKSAEYLKDLSQEDSRIIICVKKYAGVICQLQRIGITDYCIYDPNVNYAKKRNSMVIASADQAVVPKKYPVGYIAGVFDLFHIGHLNMFKRAKEQCDYLIVGVLPDAGVRHNKKANPFIPFQERMEIVKACRYVDEVIEIPLSYGGIKDAFRMVQFDCKFSGSDYQNNPDWLADKQFLEKQGAEMVFFPYTEDTSSTKIKQLIEQSLL